MPRPLPHWPLHPLAFACAALFVLPARAQTPPATPAQQLPTVEVIATTPVPGTGVPRDHIPANVQTGDAQRLRQLQSLNLPDFLSSQIGSGAMPVEALPSWGLRLRRGGKGGSGRALQQLAKCLRELDRPVIGRIHDDALWLDLRCLEEGDEAAFASQLEELRA